MDLHRSVTKSIHNEFYGRTAHVLFYVHILYMSFSTNLVTMYLQRMSPADSPSGWQSK